MEWESFECMRDDFMLGCTFLLVKNINKMKLFKELVTRIPIRIGRGANAEKLLIVFENEF